MIVALSAFPETASGQVAPKQVPDRDPFMQPPAAPKPTPKPPPKKRDPFIKNPVLTGKKPPPQRTCTVVATGQTCLNAHLQRLQQQRQQQLLQQQQLQRQQMLQQQQNRFRNYVSLENANCRGDYYACRSSLHSQTLGCGLGAGTIGSIGGILTAAAYGVGGMIVCNDMAYRSCQRKKMVCEQRARSMCMRTHLTPLI